MSLIEKCRNQPTTSKLDNALHAHATHSGSFQRLLNRCSHIPAVADRGRAASAVARDALVGMLAKAMDYMLKRWGSFARFLDDGRICLTNNAAERALRGICLGRKSWLFAGSDRGAVRAAVMYTLIGTAKLNDVDPQAWLADVLDRIADLPQTRLQELLPWSWKADRQQALAA